MVVLGGVAWCDKVKVLIGYVKATSMRTEATVSGLISMEQLAGKLWVPT